MPDWKRPEWESSKAPKFQTPAPAFDLSPNSNRRMEVWHLQWFNEAYRVLRPGGVIKAFSGTRTFHRMAAAMHEAGFIDLRLESWNYGSGFPKSMNIGKALDKQAVAFSSDGPSEMPVTLPATDASHQWEGWGTALKPSWEPVVVGRKPE
jgi:site-specific DNA-methyltransferase (adenine-specific)